MRDQTDFWNRVSEKYAATPIKDGAAYARKLSLTQDQLASWMDVLELGCGTGTTAIHHAPFVKAIHAVDTSPKMIDIARHRASEAGVINITFECKPVEALDLQERSQDVVMAHSFLHLVADPAQLIEKAYRWLRPGGLFISNTPCIGEVSIWFRPLISLGQAIGQVPLLTVFDRDQLHNLMAQPGFQIEERMRIKFGTFLIARKPGLLIKKAA
jgi:ubiquinone/menaquinone biosynthesis C-methylase UbiE